eukprot:2178934-Rhodomonas_salina.2
MAGLGSTTWINPQYSMDVIMAFGSVVPRLTLVAVKQTRYITPFPASSPALTFLASARVGVKVKSRE